MHEDGIYGPNPKNNYDKYKGWTYVETIETILDGTQRQSIRQDMPDQILFIYGISTSVGGVTPANDPIVFPGEDLLLYVELVRNATDLWDNYRLDKLIRSADADLGYFPVKLPGKIDMDRSVIINPTAITGRTVILDLLYIPKGYNSNE